MGISRCSEPCLIKGGNKTVAQAASTLPSSNMSAFLLVLSGTSELIPLLHKLMSSGLKVDHIT